MVFPRRVWLCNEEGVDEFQGVGYKVLVLAVDAEDGEDGVLADVGMPKFKTGADSRDERFEELDVGRYFLKEAESCAANVFVWVSQVIVDGVAARQSDQSLRRYSKRHTRRGSSPASASQYRRTLGTPPSKKRRSFLSFLFFIGMTYWMIGIRSWG